MKNSNSDKGIVQCNNFNANIEIASNQVNCKINLTVKLFQQIFFNWSAKHKLWYYMLESKSRDINCILVFNKDFCNNE